MRFRLTALLLAALLPAAAAAGTGTTDWMLGYQGKSTNEFIWDKRATPLINSRVPAKLSEQVQASLGGPPDPVIITDDRYVSVAACRPHSCMEKGFLWVDTKTGAGLGAYHLEGALQLGSNSLSADHIPPQARAALIAWLGDQDLQTTSVEFIGRDGKRQALAVARYSAPPTYHPTSTGPAFDCKLAATAIEKTICGDSGLSAQDLALSELYNRIRLGSATTTAQAQLRDLQRAWLKDRNQQCAQSANSASCLKAQYTAQYDKLNHWIPTQGK